MDDLVTSAILPALAQIFGAGHIYYLVAGVVIGLAVGILPGLGGVAGMAIILPFIFGMDPTAALAMMIGVTSVTATSDTFPSVLIGVPGSSSSQATVLDGFPMAKKGEAARALGAAFSASLIGGVFGALVLTVAIFFAQPLLLAIGFGEQLLLIVLALTLVGMLTGPSAVKGLAACGIGLLLGSVGSATATAEYRLTFDALYLTDGFKLVIIGLGMFAVPEIIDTLRHRDTISETGRLGKGWLQGLRDTLENWWLVLRCSAIGSVVGALPGLGGSVIDWIAYGHLAQTTKNKETLGTGDVRGVIAPESANNAKEGGALIPTLLFGIPGSGSMALLLGGLLLVGIEPGREMVEDNLSMTFTIVWSIALANIFGAGICLMLAGPIARVTTIRYTLIAPFLIVIIFFAAFQASQSWEDLVALCAIGILGIYMKRFGWSRAALLIGFVLSERIEAAFYRTAQVYGMSFLTRPTAMVLMAIVLLSGYLAWRTKTRVGETTLAMKDDVNRLPQLAFVGAIAVALAVVAYDVSDLRWLGRLFPWVVTGLTALAVAYLVWAVATKKSPHPVVYDTDAATGDDASERSLWFCLAWFLGLLMASALIGFLLAAPLFVLVFLIVLARAPVSGSLIGALGIFGLLKTLETALALEYPQGLLQMWKGTNWPF
ncbi:MAG: hypothetical protein RLZ98_12 [Pseudomonadota bacterium]|jgi:TctA family transporter